jgi:hypothetical protein
MECEEIRCIDMNRIQLAQYRVKWQALVNMVIKL